ncbi:hypothetical protein GcC1_070020 [Golovinomyces cichoracearum]|uniref:Uncharacterized protein n=1 Tax=Golovinomyces cichoracearum TaxID=62708 RepID=A0A420IQ19_9PEZI|nr:hypothetical protein GcC1_070020 [Golovinomyces cichoracearum]
MKFKVIWPILTTRLSHFNTKTKLQNLWQIEWSANK